MRYISARPARLYCATCEEIYGLPQGGDIKLFSGSVCPLDSFELLLFTMGGKDGKKYPLCPFCYNNPPFEDISTASSGQGAKQRAEVSYSTAKSSCQATRASCHELFCIILRRAVRGVQMSWRRMPL